MIRAASLLLAASMLGGCISLLPKPPPPPRTYVLEARAVEPLQGAPIDAVIAVAQPTGERAILGFDLIWRTGDTINRNGRTGPRMRCSRFWRRRSSIRGASGLRRVRARRGRIMRSVGKSWTSKYAKKI